MSRICGYCRRRSWKGQASQQHCKQIVFFYSLHCALTQQVVIHLCHISNPELIYECNVSHHFIGVRLVEKRAVALSLVPRLRVVGGSGVVVDEASAQGGFVRDLSMPTSDFPSHSSRCISLAARSENGAGQTVDCFPTLSPDHAIVLAQVRSSGQLRVRVVTWNMCAEAPPTPEVLREKLLPFETYHLLVIGSEECENSIARSLLNTSKARWESTLHQVLGSAYEVLVGHTLQATHSIAFLHRGLLPLVRGVGSFAVATGPGVGSTRLGSKGGIGLSVRIGGANLLFFNAHLSHKTEALAQRNDEYHAITAEVCRRLTPKAAPKAAPLAPQGGVQAETERALEAFDVVIWAGDLNYRVALPRAEADARLAADDFGALLDADQLNSVRLGGAAFKVCGHAA